MPKVQSSSKSGTSLVLFATERRHINETRHTLEWTAEHTDDTKLSVLCGETNDRLAEILKMLPEPEKTAKK